MAQLLSRLVGFRCESLNLHVRISNDNQTQANDVFLEHTNLRVRDVQPWNMIHRLAFFRPWDPFMLAAYQLPPVHATDRDSIRAANGWARSPLCRHGINRMPQSRIRWKTCLRCQWARQDPRVSFNRYYRIPEPVGYLPNIVRMPRSLLVTPRRRNPYNPTCTCKAVLAAISEASRNGDSPDRPPSELWEDCRSWVGDVRHVIILSELQGTFGVENNHPSVACLHKVAKLPQISVSFEWWDGARLVPVMQLGTFRVTNILFRVVCFTAG